MLGVVGDSAAGKTTLTRGLARILGEEEVTRISADHYHRYDRRQRAKQGLTPLTPECNHLDIHTQAMCDVYDVRVYLDEPEDLRRRWKLQRDCSRRGYTTDEVLEELDRREADAEAYVRPQRRKADLVIAFVPGTRGDQEHLDARVTMRPGLVHPDLSPFVGGDGDGITLLEQGNETSLYVPGTIPSERSEAIQEAVWDRMHFASHLRAERLGEFTVGTALQRSESLAITQLLVLYQLVTARAAIALGAPGARAEAPPAETGD
jgi:phosphoribulokinase